MFRSGGLFVALAVYAAFGLAAAQAAVGDAPAARPAGSPAAPGPVQLAQGIPAACEELFRNKPEDPNQQLAWYKEVGDCIKENPVDQQPPELQYEAPEEVDAAGDSYTITGFVGDDGSVPKLLLDRKPVALVEAGADAPALCDAPDAEAPVRCKYTFAFKHAITIVGEGENRFILEAVDEAGNNVAEEIVVRVIVTNRPKFKGAYHALIIGNGVYVSLPRLETAVKDAEAVADVIQRRYVFDKENITVLTNATRREILGRLVGLRKSLGADDRLLIYYSGHGYIDEATQSGFWQPADAEELDDFTWIAIDDVVRQLKGMAADEDNPSAKHVLVIVDSVFPVTRTRGVPRRKRDEYFETIDSYVSRKMISSGVSKPTPNERSGEHSVFADELVKILEANQEPYITSQQLFDKLTQRILVTSDQKPEWGTVPNAGDEGSGEFTFILRSKPVAAAD
ncbi:MAG: caspase family protein [Proteobacteria bacterium]|nr:caspase family protein [Pseudomonadota bacterium]